MALVQLRNRMYREVTIHTIKVHLFYIQDRNELENAVNLIDM